MVWAVPSDVEKPLTSVAMEVSESALPEIAASSLAAKAVTWSSVMYLPRSSKTLAPTLVTDSAKEASTSCFTAVDALSVTIEAIEFSFSFW